MSSPAREAKFVVAVVVGVVGAGTFAGVSHDGRGGAAPEAPATTTAVLAPPASTTLAVPASTLAVPPSTLAVPASTLAAEPAPPDPVPTRARLRSRGS